MKIGQILTQVKLIQLLTQLLLVELYDSCPANGCHVSDILAVCFSLCILRRLAIIDDLFEHSRFHYYKEKLSSQCCSLRRAPDSGGAGVTQ